MEPQTSTTEPRRVLIISQDIVGSRMAGPGIRYWEMARVLAGAYQVTLVAPQPIDRGPEDVVVGSYAWNDASSLRQWLDPADVVIANGYVLMGHPELARIEQPLALDLYDPFLLENLEYTRAAPAEQRSAQHRQDLALWNLQLSAGDFFLCATERQRDLYIGALTTTGRVTHDVTDDDPLLRRLIDVVPFGVSREPPTKRRPVLRDVVPGIAASDYILLWTGGLWDWLDPLTLVRAMPLVIERHPQARLVFLAGRHPGAVPPMRIPEETKAQADALGLLDRCVFFYEQWIPYEERADFLLEADIAVSLHHNHLETAYAAVRSRFLDHLWAGLPSIVTDGDAAAELVRQHRLGKAVVAGSVDETAAALVDLLADGEERQACASRAQQLATTFAWHVSMRPLMKWCAVAHKRERQALSDAEAVANLSAVRPAIAVPDLAQVDTDEQRNNALGILDTLWRIDERPAARSILAPLRRFVVQQFVRPSIVPLLQQQNAYNAALAKALYALADSSDKRRSATQDALASLAVREVKVHEIDARLQTIERWVETAQQQIATVQQQTATLEQRIADLQEHVLDLDDADTDLAELLLEKQLEPNDHQETTG